MYKYKSFISYSRAADAQLAPALKSALQGFAKSWYKLKAIQVFVDQTNLTANPALWSSIEKNLGNSEYFIYLASPQAAQSKWVRKEISFFHGRTGVDKMIIILTDGNISWDDAKTDFNWQLTDAIPKFDQAIFTQEPIWIDLRWIRKEQLTPRDPRFLDAIANLSSVLRGIDKDTLIGKDVEEHRKAKRFRLFSITGLSLLALFLVTATLIAIKNLQLSQDRLTKTYSNNGSELLKSGDYAMAIPWFIEAWQNERDKEKKQLHLYRIENLFNQLPLLTQVWQDTLPVLATTFVDSNTVLILNGNVASELTNEFNCIKNSQPCRATLRTFDVQTGKEVIKPIVINDGLRSFAINRDKTLFASFSIQNVLRLWSLQDGKLLWQQGFDIPASDYHEFAFFSRLQFDKQGKKLLFAIEDYINIYETSQGNILKTLQRAPLSCTFSEDGNTLFFLNDGRLFSRDIHSNRISPIKLPYFDEISAFQFSPNYTHMVFVGAKANKNFEGYGPSNIETIVCVRVQNLQEPVFTKNADYGSGSLNIQFDEHQHVLGINSGYTTEAGSGDDGTRVFDVLNGNPLTGWIKFPQQVNFSFDSSGKKIAISCRDGNTEIWRVEEPGYNDAAGRLWIIHDGHEHVESIFSPDNKFLLTSGWGHIVKLWKIPPDDFVPFTLFDDFEEKEIYDTTIKWNVDYGNKRKSRKNPIDSSAIAFIYDTKTKKPMGKPLKHNGEVYIAARSYDGNYIATASFKEACVWKGSTQEKLYDFPDKENAAIAEMSFSQDSKKILISFSDYTFRVWDLATGKPITPYIKHISNTSYVAVTSATARFSSDGRKIITSDHDTYCIWDVMTGEPLSAPLKVYLFSSNDVEDSTLKKTWLDQSKANTFSIRSLSVDDIRNYSSLVAAHELDVNSSFAPLTSEDFIRKWASWKTLQNR